MYGVLSDSEAHHTIAVISAKAEIQALNDQEPPEGRLFDFRKANGGSPYRGRVPLLCTSKEKEPAVGQPPTSSLSSSPKAIRQKRGQGRSHPQVNAAVGGSTRKVP
jgi:hypothetical protein